MPIRTILRRLPSLIPIIFLFYGQNLWAKIESGPWINNIAQSEVEILWEQDQDVPNGVIHYGIHPTDLASTVTGEAFSLRPLVYRATLKNLQASTRYYYRLTQLTTQISGTFKTAVRPMEPFSFVVLGDTRSGHEAHAGVIRAIVNDFAGDYPDFYINTGDLVASGESIDDWHSFFEIEKILCPMSVFVPAFGNHEGGDNLQPSLFRKFFSSGAYYAFPYGNSLFLIIDTEDPTLTTPGTPQRQFILDQLKNASINPEIRFKFVIFHQPGMTTSSHSPTWVITAPNGLIDLFEEYNVDAIFMGHNHNYEHTFVNGIHHLVSGGGGAGLYDFDFESDSTVYKESAYHFLRVSVFDSYYSVEAKKVDPAQGRVMQVMDSYAGETKDGGFPGHTPLEFMPVDSSCGILALGTSPFLILGFSIMVVILLVLLGKYFRL
jgi:hypothetical protein